MLGRLAIWLCVGCLGAVPYARGAVEPDHLRALLYRVDGETRIAYLHPSEAIEHAQAAERMAGDLAARASREPALRPQAARLQASVHAMAEAARRHEPEDVRAAARNVAIEVRVFDESLPAPDLR